MEVRSLGLQVAWLFLLALPSACRRTVTHGKSSASCTIFSCDAANDSKHLWQRKLCYLFGASTA